jgi:cation:H+ antiporter
MIAPVPVEESFLRVDLWVMLASALILLPFVISRWDMTRPIGLGLTALYGVYVAFLLS